MRQAVADSRLRYAELRMDEFSKWRSTFIFGTLYVCTLKEYQT